MSFRFGLGRILDRVLGTVAETFTKFVEPEPEPEPERQAIRERYDAVFSDLEGFTSRPVADYARGAGYGTRRHMDIEYVIDMKDGTVIEGYIERMNKFDAETVRRMIIASEYEIDVRDLDSGEILIDGMRAWIDDVEFIYDEEDFDTDASDYEETA